MSDLFKKGDIIEYYEYNNTSIYGSYPLNNKKYQISNKKYQIGNKLYSKKKLLEINSPIVTDVELYDYNKGEIIYIEYNHLQLLLASKKYIITGREKKKFKL